MTFSIITPAFKQTEWLRLCILSVADQAGWRAGGQGADIINQSSEGRDQGSDADAQVSCFRFLNLPWRLSISSRMRGVRVLRYLHGRFVLGATLGGQRSEGTGQDIGTGGATNEDFGTLLTAYKKTI